MMFIHLIPFSAAPLSNSEILEGGAGPSRRREEPIIIDRDTLVTPKPRDGSVTSTNKKGKKKDKKVVMGGLVSSTTHFSSSNIVFPPIPIPYTQTEAFHASFQPSLRYGAPLETFSPITYPSHEGVILLRDREPPLIQQDLDDDRDTFYDEESNMHFCYYLGGNPPESDEQPNFAKTHWMINSGCTDHLSPFLDDFVHLGTVKRSATVANGGKVSMYGPGTILLKQIDDALPSIHIKLEDVWYAPQASNRLLSVTSLTNHGYCCEITSKGSSIWDKKGREVIWATASSSSNNLHWFQSALITPVIGSIASLADQQSYSIWHQHFGHTSRNALRHAHKQLSSVPLLEISPSHPPCHGCAVGKMPDCPFPGSSKCASHPLALVHMDLVSPFPVEPRSRARYILTFIDDYTGYALLAFLRVKSAVKTHRSEERSVGKECA